MRNKSEYEWPLTLYIALEEANFLWNKNEMVRFHEMWKKRLDIRKMAQELKRHQIEIAMLVLDQFGLTGMLNGIQGSSESVA
ncbi:helix-turn-helix domain containing protein [Bacillus manliponensis]|uniref:helix-turn-helix domain containing protein n=1 Tax=Bacillus manliponensis TaxID=574376 RepID=UPI0039EE91C5